MKPVSPTRSTRELRGAAPRWAAADWDHTARQSRPAKMRRVMPSILVTDGSYLYLLAIFGGAVGPAQLCLDARAERILRLGLAVNDERFGRRPGKTVQPVQDLVGVGVRRHGVDVLDPRRDRDPLAVDLHALLAVHQPAAARAGPLVAGEEDRVARIRQRRLEVVQHSPALGHPAGGNHD